MAGSHGSPASLSDYTGHPVLINFWPSWCTPCRDGMPLIVAAYQAHQQARQADSWLRSGSTSGFIHGKFRRASKKFVEYRLSHTTQHRRNACPLRGTRSCSLSHRSRSGR